MMLALLLLLMAAAPAEAQSPTAQSPTPQGDPERGWFIASGGVPRAGACFPCHGLAGEGDDAQAVPRLAGLSPWYLYKQMKNYTDGTRDNEIMSPIAEELSVQDWWDIGAFYSRLETPLPPPPELPAEVAEHGRRLAEESCAACHGDQGQGATFAVPYLAGQGARYMEEQLRAWVTGDRRNDPAGAMRTIAEGLSPTDMAAVAAYYEALRSNGKED